MFQRFTTSFIGAVTRLRSCDASIFIPIRNQYLRPLKDKNYLKQTFPKRRNIFGFLFASSLLGFTGLYKLLEAKCKSVQDIQAELDKALKEKGEESEEALRLYYEIGFWYMHEGRREECMDSFRRYLKIVRKKFGSESHEFSHALTQVASVFTFFQNYALAIDTLREALDIKKRLYGGSHMSVAQCYLNLGLIFSLIKDYENATDHLRKAYKEFQKLEAEEGHFTLLALSTLASTIKASGKKSEALQVYEQLYAAQLIKYGPDHPETKKSKVTINDIRQELKP